jgi:galactonate dehydratase
VNTIQTVEAIPVRLARDIGAATGTAGSPTVLGARAGGYRWSSAYPVLYSEHIETTLVKVTLNDGTVGWGEAQAPVAPRVSEAVIVDILAAVLEGESFGGDRASIEALWTRMYSAMRVRGQTGGFMLDAISGVDLALWDLAGKVQGCPVSTLLAGDSARRTVPAYMSGVPGGSLEARVAFARAQHAQGFRIFKLYHDSHQAVLTSVLDALSDALPDSRFALDALWRFEWPESRSMLEDLQRRNLLWLECPFPPEETEWHRRFAAELQIPLAVGESYRTRYEVEPFFGIAKYLQPDLGRCGITETMRIAARAAGHGIEIVPHVSIALGPQIAAAIHAAASIPKCRLCEFNPNVFTASNRYLYTPLSLDGSCYQTPTAPGLGIEIREPEVRKNNLL